MDYVKRNKPLQASPKLRAAIMEVVDNQLRDNTPPETRQTLARLIGQGYSTAEAKRLIAHVVVSEIFDILKQGQPYNQARYVAALHRLPQTPGD